MDYGESAIVREWRRYLSHTREWLLLDGRTREAKKIQARSSLILSQASDDDLEKMAELEADLFDMPVEQTIKVLRESRETVQRTVTTWRKYLGFKQRQVASPKTGG